jgi:hypothetical protein
VNAILMTALTSALGMLPLAIASGADNKILQLLARRSPGGQLDGADDVRSLQLSDSQAILLQLA